ncbi:hypothetical protein [Geodermatophilus chilensis]|uniref:hypothetical protein n=1 Tax=Geodermatophilus chilensis TaxID=2035835 RepID=UPI000C25667D|nr:hypothetical protein [Geodermatophilus chilensis]
MAVEVKVPKPGSTSVLTDSYENGESFGIKDGILHVFSEAHYQRTTDQIAVYAAGHWISAVVKQG